MHILRRLFNPLAAFIAIQVIWVLVLVFWVYWFMGTHRRLRQLAEQYSPELLHRGADWFILVEGILLLVAILVGVYVIFVYWSRQRSLYRAQRNFISQVTHELKSPLSSLQLHLETIRRRPPPPEQLEDFVDTMLSDTERLNNLITNLLSASRLDHRRVRFAMRTVDISRWLEEYLDNWTPSLPRRGTLSRSIQPDLYARVEAESLEMVVRNLLENAVLYSPDPPRIRVDLFAEGRHVHLSVSDRGKGVEPRYQKKVFRMFYRVRVPSAKTIRGTGLGLFITRAVVRVHKGKVWLESAGLGKGTTVHILLPRVEPPAEEASP